MSSPASICCPATRSPARTSSRSRRALETAMSRSTWSRSETSAVLSPLAAGGEGGPSRARSASPRAGSAARGRCQPGTVVPLVRGADPCEESVQGMAESGDLVVATRVHWKNGGPRGPLGCAAVPLHGRECGASDAVSHQGCGDKSREVSNDQLQQQLAQGLVVLAPADSRGDDHHPGGRSHSEVMCGRGDWRAGACCPRLGGRTRRLSRQ